MFRCSFVQQTGLFSRNIHIDTNTTGALTKRSLLLPCFCLSADSVFVSFDYQTDCVFFRVSVKYGLYQARSRTSSLRGASLNAVQGSESHRTG